MLSYVLSKRNKRSNHIVAAVESVAPRLDGAQGHILFSYDHRQEFRISYVLQLGDEYPPGLLEELLVSPVGIDILIPSVN